jgi:hypothetical protein
VGKVKCSHGLVHGLLTRILPPLEYKYGSIPLLSSSFFFILHTFLQLFFVSGMMSFVPSMNSRFHAIIAHALSGCLIESSLGHKYLCVLGSGILYLKALERVRWSEKSRIWSYTSPSYTFLDFFPHVFVARKSFQSMFGRCWREIC